MISRKAVLAVPVRTAIQAMNGRFKDLTGAQLGGFAFRELLKRSRLKPEQINRMILSMVLPVGQAPDCQVLHHAGIPLISKMKRKLVNTVCCSGLQILEDALMAIMFGEDCVALIGAESMTGAHRLHDARKLAKFREFLNEWFSGNNKGNPDLGMLDKITGINSTFVDGLKCSITGMMMLEVAEQHLRDRSDITMDEIVEFTLDLYRKSIAAIPVMEDIIFPVEVDGSEVKTDCRLYDTDGNLLKLDADTIRNEPAFLAKATPAGVLNKYTCSSTDDCSGGLLACEAQFAKDNGLTILAELVAVESAYREPDQLFDAPPDAARLLAEKLQIGVQEVDAWFMTVPFSSVGIANENDLGLEKQRVNPLGGKGGHPIGFSGLGRTQEAVLWISQHPDAKLVFAGACGGGGRATFVALRPYKP